MGAPVDPLKSDKFISAATEYIKPLKGTHIFDSIVRDYRQKTELEDAGYGPWLRDVLAYLMQEYRLPGKRILDLGCGTGELTVRMRSLGYESYGFDLHKQHIELARILAQENGFSANMFVLGGQNGNQTDALPFNDKTFDVVTLFSVLEHLSDPVLQVLLPEIHRVCRGVAFVLVPNRLKVFDDHTGLRLLPWMPRPLAVAYLKTRGRKHQYYISADSTWDVYFRTFGRISSIIKRAAFGIEFIPDELVYPPLSAVPPIARLGKTFALFGKRTFVGLQLSWLLKFRRNYPRQALYPYLNMAWFPRKTD